MEVIICAVQNFYIFTKFLPAKQIIKRDMVQLHTVMVNFSFFSIVVKIYVVLDYFIICLLS